MNDVTIRVGTAGWTLPKQHAAHFPAEGTHLQRCAGRLTFVEVNSSFHRPHRRATWERWAATTPPEFRFAVKMPKRITHEAKLVNTGGAMLQFFAEVGGLGQKLGPVLVQLPPSFAFDEGLVREFFATLRELHTGDVVCEPRHATWFTGVADRLLREFDVARVAADPAKGSERAADPGGSAALQYWRLHGAPRTYYSEYSEEFLRGFAKRILENEERKPERLVWVVFDNTALGHATANALRLLQLVRDR